jgi:hypothetical protein
MHNLVCVTPAGRRRYMKILIPQVLSSPKVSRYDIWLNTKDKSDLLFFEFLEKKFNNINLIEQPEGKVDGIKSINSFFKHTINPNEIYLRLDDDIVWIEPNFFETMYNKRIEDKNSFLITPLTINNAICTHLLQQYGKYQYKDYLPAICMNKTMWNNPDFAKNLHSWFLNHISHNTYETLKINDNIIALNRFSINSICWYGSDFDKFNGLILGDEEEYLSVIKPSELSKYNKIIGDTVIAHYSFYPQRNSLDKTSILNQYEKATRDTYSKCKEAIEIFDVIDSYFNENEKLIHKAKKYHLINSFEIKNKIKKIRVPVIRFKQIEDLVRK